MEVAPSLAAPLSPSVTGHLSNASLGADTSGPNLWFQFGGRFTEGVLSLLPFFFQHLELNKMAYHKSSERTPREWPTFYEIRPHSPQIIRIEPNGIDIGMI